MASKNTVNSGTPNNPGTNIGTNPASKTGPSPQSTYSDTLKPQTSPSSQGVSGVAQNVNTNKTLTAAQNVQKSIAKAQEGIVGVQPNKQCKDSDFFTVTRTDAGANTSGEGFSLQTYTPPKAPAATPHANPPKNTASTTTPERGMNCGTNTGLANSRLTFECNFVAGIQLDTCVFKLKKQIDMYVSMAAELIWSKLQDLFPSGSHIKKFIENICKSFNTIYKMICMIQQIVQCIISTVTGIMSVITWALSVPAKFLAMIMQCITSFISSIFGAMGDLTSILKTVLGVIGCSIDECKPVTSIYDIGDTANTIYGSFTG